VADPVVRENINSRRRETYDAEMRRAYREERYETIRLIERRYHLKSKYGMTPEEYDLMVAEQEGRCRICKDEVDLLYVDHCHTTLVRRGGLCDGCNFGLGHFKDDPARLRAAADYLEEFQLAQRIKDVHTA
jgi:hypothetical protein